MKKGKSKTASDLLRELEQDPRFRAEQAERDAQVKREEEALRVAAAPLIRDLEGAGIVVGSVWDLVNSENTYPAAVPVLLNHLGRDYPVKIREGIARSLGLPAARHGWPIMLRRFEDLDEKNTSGEKWGLACALAVIADEDVLDDVLRLIADPRHGENRAPLVEVLGRLGGIRSIELLSSVQADPAIGTDARRALRRLTRHPKPRGDQ